MGSQVSHEWLVDGQDVNKQNFRDEVDQIAAEMNHGGFFTRLADSAPNTLAAERLLDQFVSVRSDFGAPRNFSTSTEASDASAAINNAIDAVATTWGRGTVYLPPGVFWVSSPIILKPNVKLIGAGMHQTVIKLKNGAATHVITHGANTDTALSAAHFTVDGNRSASGNRRWWYDGINIQHIVDALDDLHNLRILNCTRDGLHLSGGRSASTFNMIICSACDRYGIYVQNWDNFFGLCQGAATGTDNFRIAGGPNKFTNCKAFFAGQGTMRFTAWPNNFFGESMLGSTSDGFDNTSPGQNDWRTGSGVNNSGGLNEFAGFEIQDTWGPGFVQAGSEDRFNGIIGNVGDLAPGGPRHNAAGWPDTNDRYSGVRACVDLATTYDCYFDFTTRAQSVRFQNDTTMCDYVARNTASGAKNIKLRALVAITNAAGGAATHVNNLSILESAPKDPTVELLVNSL